ncbi:hypothetical protein [uncultured Shewanella sp.]|uniref:hypothetical protein n=1 Tax=uncultured Shewanella sp. TaxID=173975 RepID=UPI002615117C|nr:hypothetical protein [uncultured Shewanella sp.]
MPKELYILGLLFSCVALIISAFTAWATFFNKGKLLMTRPVLIFFGPDISPLKSNRNKVYLRTLLYSSAKRGNVIESLYLSLQRNETKQNFNVWAYGERGSLKVGSGLYVPEEGVTFDHHFVLPEDGGSFEFMQGEYKLCVFAKLVNKKSPQKLSEIELVISENQAEELSKDNSGIFFNWGPEKQSYHSYIDKRPTHI